MGRLVEGKWVVESLIPESKDGSFKRQDQKFRERITELEKDRYHLYVSLACPWAHRTLIMLKLKKLEENISVSVVSPLMLDNGWSLDKDFPGSTGDKILQKNFLWEIYTTADPAFTGKVTVPVLFDQRTKKIINNESAEIILNFNDLAGGEDYYPQALRSEIDEVNEDIYHHINNGVYKTGFAQKQEAYEKSFDELFSALDRIDQRLQGKKFLVGERLTVADIRLYTTLVRFDSVYYVHFKCNRTLIRNFSNLSGYLKSLYEIPAFRETTDFDHIKTHYYESHRQYNPYGIIARGPDPVI